MGSPTHHSGVQCEDEDDTGARVKINHDCAVISYSVVENVVATILKVGGGENYDDDDYVQVM